MVLLVGLGDQRRDFLYGGEDGDLLPAGVHHQHLVAEAEALQRRLVARLAAGRAECRGVDALHVLAKCVVHGRDRIDRTCHDRHTPSALLRASPRWRMGCAYPLGAMKRRCTPRFAYRTRSS